MLLWFLAYLVGVVVVVASKGAVRELMRGNWLDHEICVGGFICKMGSSNWLSCEVVIVMVPGVCFVLA